MSMLILFNLLVGLLLLVIFWNIDTWVAFQKTEWLYNISPHSKAVSWRTRARTLGIICSFQFSELYRFSTSVWTAPTPFSACIFSLEGTQLINLRVDGRPSPDHLSSTIALTSITCMEPEACLDRWQCEGYWNWSKENRDHRSNLFHSSAASLWNFQPR